MQRDERDNFMSGGRKVTIIQGGGGFEVGLEAGTYNLLSLEVLAIRTASQGIRRS